MILSINLYMTILTILLFCLRSCELNYNSNFRIYKYVLENQKVLFIQQNLQKFVEQLHSGHTYPPKIIHIKLMIHYAKIEICIALVIPHNNTTVQAASNTSLINVLLNTYRIVVRQISDSFKTQVSLPYISL